MLSKFMVPGERIELQVIEGSYKDYVVDDSKNLLSQLSEIITDDTIEITMPMDKSQVVILPIACELNIVFYTQMGLYNCMGRIIDRYKNNNVFLLVVELTSNLMKYQRREFYRFNCALEMCTRTLEKNEISAVERKIPVTITEDLPLKHSIIIDISGGGLRFVCSQKYDVGNLLYCSYYLTIKGERKKYDIVGKVLSAKEVENRDKTYEHRVQYQNIDANTREEIIKFIFEEDRKNRQKDWI